MCCSGRTAATRYNFGTISLEQKNAAVQQRLAKDPILRYFEQILIRRQKLHK
jgi:hypothetical protein